MPTSSHRWSLIALTLATLSAPSWALYKVVGPDGKVTYTDRAPPEVQGKAVPVQRAADAPAEASLPFALREVARRFPVTLYTAPECVPCNQGRELLKQRGIPFRERVARTPTDRTAWLAITGASDAPALTIGGQTLHGFAADNWHTYLDTAGYPRSSQLPPNYAAPPPQPLTAPPPVAEATADERPQVAPAPPATAPNADARTGIRF